MKRYSIANDYDYAKSHKRERLTLWSGAFCSEFEGVAMSLPRMDGYSVSMSDGRKIRVSCPCPRTDSTYRVVDDAINSALCRDGGAS